MRCRSHIVSHAFVLREACNLAVDRRPPIKCFACVHDRPFCIVALHCLGFFCVSGRARMRIASSSFISLFGICCMHTCAFFQIMVLFEIVVHEVSLMITHHYSTLLHCFYLARMHRRERSELPHERSIVAASSDAAGALPMFRCERARRSRS